jgi:hypothetical protein
MSDILKQRMHVVTIGNEGHLATCDIKTPDGVTAAIVKAGTPELAQQIAEGFADSWNFNRNKQAFVVMVLGYWGSGQTVRGAAQKCIDVGASRTEKASLRLVIGDDKPEVDGNGYLLRDRDSACIYMGMGYTLGQLAKLKD